MTTDRLRGFGGEIYTLKVGPDEEQLLVPGNILTLVPYFERALSSGSFTESTTKTFELPDDDPKAVADVLYFVHTGRVEALSPFNTLGITTAFQAYLRAFIVADKYKAEAVANNLVDAIIRRQSGCVVNPASICILGNAGLHGTPLYTDLMRELYRQSVKRPYRGHTFLGPDPGKTTLEEATHGWSKEDFRQFMVIVGEGPPKGTIFGGAGNMCDFHMHDLTERCTQEEQKS